MICPTCGAWSEVSETRSAKQGMIKRRRVCANGHRFSTFEVLPQVVKAAGSGNTASTAKAAAASAARWARDRSIARDLRPASQVAKDHGITEARVRQIRASLTSCSTPPKTLAK